MRARDCLTGRLFDRTITKNQCSSPQSLHSPVNKSSCQERFVDVLRDIISLDNGGGDGGRIVCIPGLMGEEDLAPMAHNYHQRLPISTGIMKESGNERPSFALRTSSLCLASPGIGHTLLHQFPKCAIPGEAKPLIHVPQTMETAYLPYRKAIARQQGQRRPTPATP